MKIDYEEILRYLGYRGNSADAGTLTQIDECVSEIQEILPQRTFAYKMFDMEIHKEDGNERIMLKDSVVALEGIDIAMHLKGCGRCALMAVTLGVELERKLAYNARFHLGRALIMDAVASATVEAICDDVQTMIRLEAEASGYQITTRFSPGYGDLSLGHQRPILRALDAERKLGLTLTESNLLIPRKSVTAIIGLYKGTVNENCTTTAGLCGREDRSNKCDACTLKNCRFRRGDDNGRC